MSEPKILGQFQLEHRTIQVSGDDGNAGTVWLRRVHPDPPMALGCVVELDSSTPRLRLYRAEWPDALREQAKEQTLAIWRSARSLTRRGRRPRRRPSLRLRPLRRPGRIAT